MASLSSRFSASSTANIHEQSIQAPRCSNALEFFLFVVCRDTRNLAEKGVSPREKLSEWRNAVRDTWFLGEKGVSRQEIARKVTILLVAIQVFPQKMVCRCTEKEQNGLFPFAIQ